MAKWHWKKKVPNVSTIYNNYLLGTYVMYVSAGVQYQRKNIDGWRKSSFFFILYLMDTSIVTIKM